MSGITTHVLDTAAGRPARGVRVTLSVKTDAGWRELASRSTDADGRVPDLLAGGSAGSAGTYRLRFDVGDYFAARGTTAFYPYVEVVFSVSEGERYHVPLLLSPFGYTTYRGS